MLAYSFGAGGGKEMYAVFPELASDYKITFDFLKLSGRSIWGCTAFGRVWGGGLGLLTQVSELCRAWEETSYLCMPTY